MDFPNVLDEKQAAPYIGVSASYLRQSRQRNATVEGPPWVKVGRRVVYLVSDLDDYLQKHRCESSPVG